LRRDIAAGVSISAAFRGLKENLGCGLAVVGGCGGDVRFPWDADADELGTG
jgi:hypothetical protein